VYNVNDVGRVEDIDDLQIPTGAGLAPCAKFGIRLPPGKSGRGVIDDIFRLRRIDKMFADVADILNVPAELIHALFTYIRYSIEVNLEEARAARES
jgi:hypothetical protein